MSVPTRPPSVPAGAVYNAEGAFWELRQENERGEAHGLWYTFTVDGALRTRGSYENGKLDGYLSRFTDGEPGSPLLRGCCVPPGAREHRTRFRAGRMLEDFFLDELGRPLSSDGTPWPERPPTIPEHACWAPHSSTFVEHVDVDETRAIMRSFSLEGALLQELDTTNGRVSGRRTFASDGVCVESTGLDEHGKNHGPYAQRLRDSETPYADARIAVVRGAHDHGERTGPWEYFEADGAVLLRVDYGAPWGDAVSPVTAGTEPCGDDAEARWNAAESSWAEGRTREAVALAARALARGGNPARFRAFLAGRVVELAATQADAYAQAADDARASVGSLLGAILGGANPAAALCGVAMAVPSTTPAAIDYVDAALKLGPDWERARAARALLRVERGDRDGALADVALLEQQKAPTAGFVRDLCRVSFPRFEFSPATDPLDPPAEELVPVEAVQPLEAVRRLVSLYATRLQLVRAELLKRLGDVAWLPPDVRALLPPSGPLELGKGTVRIEDEGETGVEVSDVEFDETLDLTGSARELFATARGDWAALSWLCWSAGLDRVALPETLSPRELFPVAAHRTTLRCWRAHDRLRSAGLVALAKDVPSFDWEGMRIDTMPSQFVAVAAREYLEVRAVFFWLMFEVNRSVFQVDLRRV